MPISEIRYEKEEVITRLNNLVERGLQVIQDMYEIPENEHKISSWFDTTQKELQNSFSNDEIAKSFLLHSQIISVPQRRRDIKKESVQSIEKSVKFIESLIEDILNGLHSKKINNTFDQPTAILIIKRILANFHLHLKTMYQDDIHGSAKIKIEDLNRIQIGNEYDVQRILYSLIKPLFPEARLEVTVDAGYRPVRYDIFIDEYDLAIEVKCTRSNMTERNLTEELGSDSFHYKVEHLFLFIYDDKRIITNADAFKRSFTREKGSHDKNIDTYIVQPIIL
ncbi:hypothetical protein ACFOQM_06355 [Paenibacillus sp. GCM10012307]|uniref:Uncharacterized protein n=1 Tax=Paenibacillus roseus TaxID=2798579 RepID=A0A934J509_9BACL|nr:hypothetical protein [Paenibacillus roseus]MBJ6360921.1 hypothetical protein [Paenibacillus roseus]